MKLPISFKLRICLSNKIIKNKIQGFLYLGTYSCPLLCLRTLRLSLCFSSSLIFSAAAPSWSPISSFRISGLSLESVGHRIFPMSGSSSFSDIANVVNWKYYRKEKDNYVNRGESIDRGSVQYIHLIKTNVRTVAGPRRGFPQCGGSWNLVHDGYLVAVHTCRRIVHRVLKYRRTFVLRTLFSVSLKMRID